MNLGDGEKVISSICEGRGKQKLMFCFRCDVLVRLAGRTTQVVFGNTALDLRKKSESSH